MYIYIYIHMYIYMYTRASWSASGPTPPHPHATAIPQIFFRWCLGGAQGMTHIEGGGDGRVRIFHIDKVSALNLLNGSLVEGLAGLRGSRLPRWSF